MSLAVAAYLEGRNSVCIEMDKSQYEKSVEWVKHSTQTSPYNTTL
jgi:site-specific DNA-methyltransferase (adenine-specific)